MTSCSPAVPPPPVTGAPVGTGAGEEVVSVGDGVGDSVGEAEACEGLADGLAEGLADGLALALDEGTRAVPLKRPVGDGEPPVRAADVASDVAMLGPAV